jgi:predicted dehydrogenase
MSAPVLLVGLGAIGVGYDLGTAPGAQAYTHARAFALHPAFALAAGVDSDESRCERFAAEYGAPAFASVEEALAAHPAEVVVIATPSDSHAGVLERVLAAATPRLVLCEKPLAPAPEAARAMVASCAARGVELCVNYFRRSLPGAVEVRRRLQAGEIEAGGKAVSWYTKGFVHNGSHFLDLLQFWLGEVATATPLGPPRAGPAGEEIDCHLRLARGDALLLAAWEERYSHFALELVAPNGRLQFGGDGRLVWQQVVPDPAAPGYHGLTAQPEAIESGLQRYQWHVAEQLARRLDGREAALCSGAQALATLETMHAALVAARGMKA